MSGWAPKRFWKEANVKPVDGGYAVELDGKPVRTPFRSLLVAPTERLADAVSAEWAAQDEKLEPQTMPLTRALNSAIDKVAPDPTPVADMLAGYAATDLLSYRATDPEELRSRQARVWDPYLDWAFETYGARLKPVYGVMPEDQDPAALEALLSAVRGVDPYALTALHEVVTLSGSLVLGLAALAGRGSGSEIWEASRLDELWQIEQWGADDEAEAAAATKKLAVEQALRFYALSRPLA